VKWLLADDGPCLGYVTGVIVGSAFIGCLHAVFCLVCLCFPPLQLKLLLQAQVTDAFADPLGHGMGCVIAAG
jgi:hypothetical protein